MYGLHYLFALSTLMRFPLAHPRPIAIPIDELAAGLFERSSNNIKSGPAGLARPRAQLMHGYNSTTAKL